MMNSLKLSFEKEQYEKFEITIQENKDSEFFAVSQKSPEKETDNEDAWIVRSWEDGITLIAMADGMGGHRDGGFASQTIIDQVKKIKLQNKTDLLRSSIHAIEEAHRKIKKRGVGAGSTAVFALIEKDQLRFINVGDSVAVHLAIKGRVKYQTLEHSPTGLALESGLISEERVAEESDHYVSNALGHGHIRIEVSQCLKLKKNDLILVGTDGLFKNLDTVKLSSYLRALKLKDKFTSLVSEAMQRMQNVDLGHPDDLTAILFQRKGP